MKFIHGPRVLVHLLIIHSPTYSLAALQEYNTPVNGVTPSTYQIGTAAQLYIWGYPAMWAWARFCSNYPTYPNKPYAVTQLLSAPVVDSAYGIRLPNVDTLYSVMLLDLSAGPLVFEKPGVDDGRMFAAQVSFKAARRGA
jgi:hypothetical protein